MAAHTRASLKVFVQEEKGSEAIAMADRSMTTSAMVTYAYDQIDQARTELEHPS